MNEVVIKADETGADAPIENEEKGKEPNIEIIDQMGVPTARAVVEEGNEEKLENKQQEERPSWLPEKFKSPEDLAKSYAELEKKLSTPKTEKEGKKETQPSDSKEEETQQKENESKKSEDKESEESSQNSSSPLAKYSEEYAEKGELSEESFAELEKIGYPREIVNRYIQGIELIQEKQVNAIFNEVGGKENYVSMTEWAAANLPKEEVDAYNDIVATNDTTKVRMASKGLWAQYVAANGKQPKLVGGSQGGNSGSVKPFKSTQEVVAAMSNAKYSSDPAYRKEVEKRLAISEVL